MLVEDNAEELEAPYPDIPAEIPRVVLESHLPATIPADNNPSREVETNKDRARIAAPNANFGPIETAIVDGHSAVEAPANGKEEHQR